jgi:hypothetical protein
MPSEIQAETKGDIIMLGLRQKICNIYKLDKSILSFNDAFLSVGTTGLTTE